MGNQCCGVKKDDGTVQTMQKKMAASGRKSKPKDGSLKPMPGQNPNSSANIDYDDDTTDHSVAASGQTQSNSMQFSLGNQNGLFGTNKDDKDSCIDNSPVGGAEDGEYVEEESFNLLNNDKISAADFDYKKVIGRGSFGKVYLVKHKETQLPYAMKILRKDHLLKKNLLIKTQAERDILERNESPYIVKLHYAFQTETKLYFVIDFLNGGEMFTYLRSENKFTESRTRMYAAELVEALSYLHKNGVLYRDLKPENILLDESGHIRITDFGLSKQNMSRQEQTKSFCGTPEYLAPDIIRGEGHSFEVDWWSLGALVYEMLNGRPPHFNRDKHQMLKDILNKDIPFNKGFSDNAKSFLKAILEKDPSKRLGGFQQAKNKDAEDDAQDIRAHPFFAGLNWDEIKKRQHKAVFIPKVRGPEDTSCIDKMFTQEGLAETPVDTNIMMAQLTTEEQKNAHFDAFTYHKTSDLLQGMDLKNCMPKDDDVIQGRQ